MNPTESRATIKHICGLWPGQITPEQSAQMSAIFESPEYSADGVKRVAAEMYRSREFFSMALLSERLRVRREAKNDEYDRTRRQIERIEEWQVRVAAHVESMTDDEWLDAFENIIYQIQEPWRGRYAADPLASRNARSVRQLVYVHRTGDEAPKAAECVL